MDILQQSLQAADILSGEDNDDLFEELGLTFNNPSTENVELPCDLASLASQGDSLYGSGTDTSAQKAFADFGNGSGFDTSQFLNTAAPVNAAAPSQVPTSAQQNSGYLSQDTMSVSARHTPFESASQDAQTSPYQSLSSAQTLAMPQNTMQSSFGVALRQSASTFPNEASKAITTIAQTVPVATCSSIFSKVPTQPLTTSVQMRSATPSADGNQGYAIQNTSSGALQLSTPIQIVQQSSAISQQGNRQLITFVQKPGNVVQVNSPASQTSTQVINGLTVQPQQTNNVAVLKIAGKNSLNLSDPQVVKALTATIQKQQIQAPTTQQSQPQFIKLNPNVINVVPQRQQQQALLRGSQQQITLQNGQTILLNNGQQVQICTPQSQSGPVQVLQSAASVQSAAVAKTNQQMNNAAVRNNQVPIKGIQIASVNIPIASSSISTTSTNVAAVPSNAVLAIPVLAKQDIGQNTATQKTVASVAVTQANNLRQTQNSATVRSLLASAILKQNNTSSNNSNAQQGIVQVQSNQTGSENVTANGPVGSTTQPQVGTMVKLNLTPQQASQLTPAQLQAILKQHQASLQARAAANAETSATGQAVASPAVPTIAQTTTPKSNVQMVQASVPQSLRPFTPTSASATTSTIKPVAAEQGTFQIFKVDPTLTEAQIDEVKKLLANRTIASKLQSLTKEQQQLVLAFQAQIKTMSNPVQQYYLRNPQLFMQKVLQQIRSGKPFILQVKTDSQQRPKIVPTVNTPKPQHPTISLTQEPNRANNSRLNASSPVMMSSFQVKTQQLPTSLASTAIMPTKHSVTLQIPKSMVKRHAPSPPAKVSLVLEQLECHKKMVTTPDCTHAFKSVRDAIRRLVPFHTCNIPNVKEEYFNESEETYDHIADRIVKRTRAMVNKYHLLCLRDSTRDSCSAEMVMVERMFLQKEKAKLSEDKTRLQENPSLIKEYFPRRVSEEITIVSDDDEEGCQAESNPATSNNSNNSAAYHETDSQVDSPLLQNGPMSSRSTESGSDSRTNHSGRYSSLDSATDPPSAKRPRTDSPEADAALLQEAVDSILI